MIHFAGIPRLTRGSRRKPLERNFPALVDCVTEGVAKSFPSGGG